MREEDIPGWAWIRLQPVQEERRQTLSGGLDQCHTAIALWLSNQGWVPHLRADSKCLLCEMSCCFFLLVQPCTCCCSCSFLFVAGCLPCCDELVEQEAAQSVRQSHERVSACHPFPHHPRRGHHQGEDRAATWHCCSIGL